jgi:hypothetical protein
VSGEPLTPPQSVEEDREAVEMLRVWWSRGEPAMALRPIFQDPQAAGVVLAHAARHIAHAYDRKGAMGEAEAHRLILKGFQQVIEGPWSGTKVEDAAASRTQ